MPPAQRRPTAAPRPFSPLPLFLTLLIPLFALLSHFAPGPTSTLLSPSPTISHSHSSLGSDSDSISSDARTALILTAHPDDEVMFFSPTILGLRKMGWDVRALCMSIGNFDGLGEIRRKELVDSYAVLGVEQEKVEIIDHQYLQDGMRYWDSMTIASIVQRSLSSNPADLIITFDKFGITRHRNHIALAHSLLHLDIPTPMVMVLHTPYTILKFTGPFYPLYLKLRSFLETIYHAMITLTTHEDGSASKAKTKEREEMAVLISSPGEYLLSLRAMMAHKSQLVWFRWLYITFSRLMWVNELELLQMS
ncbi:hypothetical protein CI109_102650 [Kwoniella shandongensis]|uniref:N-acetylglucosaminylphosphatidylinositol deacetylase n=1 Tax=Kwoniella shandongensis TaxID=1734106 RepID=A0A5M6BWF3_9TREE|nr:uncharacterized protein CI109_005230 [Kwoniella shandongensis]KAA5526460.1 hypothetical protein CI109_005230 [Kwoniella shandongensis]